MSVEAFSEGMKSEIIKNICLDEDVLFFWTILGAAWSKEEEECLLPMIVELWITIRGFSFANSLMELYKQSSKKTVQKSKGLRKKVDM